MYTQQIWIYGNEGKGILFIIIIINIIAAHNSDVFIYLQRFAASILTIFTIKLKLKYTTLLLFYQLFFQINYTVSVLSVSIVYMMQIQTFQSIQT